MISQILAASVLFFQPGANACATKGKTNGAGPAAPFNSLKRNPSANGIPRFAAGNSGRAAEARLANLLLTYPAESRTILSIPVKMKMSSFNPFGDGQTNAKMEYLPDWTELDFPAVGIQTIEKGRAKRVYQFHPKLNAVNFSEKAIEVGWYEVRPQGRKEIFYFYFDPSTLAVNKFLEGIPAGLRTFAGGRPAPNPAKITAGKAYEELQQKDLGPGYNKKAWPDTSVHGRFPTKEGEYTAVGGVQTWGIVEKEFGPFKHLYTCFEDRKLNSENEKGVPSGAGWHHIGDAAETILNTLESLPVPIAIAREHKFPNAAFGMTHTISATWLSANEAAVTKQGEFHWYVIPYEQPVCAEVWVHNCVLGPVNNWGFKCD